MLQGKPFDASGLFDSPTDSCQLGHAQGYNFSRTFQSHAVSPVGANILCVAALQLHSRHISTALLAGYHARCVCLRQDMMHGAYD